MTLDKLLIVLAFIGTQSFQLNALPDKVKERLILNKIPINTLFVKYCTEECVSCVAANMRLALNISRNRPEKAFFICQNEKDKQRLQILVENSEQRNLDNNVVFDQIIYDYLSNKFCQFYDGTKILNIESNDISSQIWRKIYDDTINLKQVGTKDFPVPAGGLNYNYTISNGQIYAMSKELNQIICINQEKIDTIDLDLKVDTIKLFSALKLNLSDSLETMNQLRNTRLYGERVIDYEILNCSNQNSLYLNLTVTAIHLLDLREKNELIQKNRMIRKSLPKGFDVNERMITNRYMFLVAKFDLDWNLIEYLEFNNLPDGLTADPYSSIFVSDKNNMVYANFDAVERTTKPLVYIELQEKGENLNFLNESKFSKPEWFNHEKVSTGFQWAAFRSVGGSPEYHMLWYPYALELDKGIVNEVPFSEIKQIAKKDKGKNQLYKWPYFQNFGMLKTADGLKYMMLRNIKTREFYYAKFTPKGEFLFLEKFPYLKNSKGKIVLYENQFVHFDTMSGKIYFFELQ